MKAKNKNILARLRQCIAEMVAEQKSHIKKASDRFNLSCCKYRNQLVFFTLMRAVVMDSVEYYINHVDRILAILIKILFGTGSAEMICSVDRS